MRKTALSEKAALALYQQYWQAKKLPFITDLYRDFGYADEPLLWLFHAEIDLPEKEKVLGANAEGFSFDDPNLALLKCFGEAIERYYSFCPTVKPTFYSTAELKQQKQEFVVPTYSREVELNEIARLPADIQIGWYQATTRQERPVWLPAQMVALQYYRQPREPFLAPSITTGMASHTTVAEAKLSGLYETIERDAFMCAFLTGATLTQLDLTSSQKLQPYLQLCDQYHFQLHVFEATTNLEVPCFIAMLVDRTGYGPALTVGNDAHHDPETAIAGAIAEAFHPRPWLRTMYLKEQAENFQQIIRPEKIHSLGSRGKYWAEPKRLSHFEYLFQLPKKPLPVAKSAVQTTEDRLAELEVKLELLGHPVYWVDLTPENLARDFAIFKAVVPTLQPLFLDQQFAAYQVGRLQEMVGFYQQHHQLTDNWEWVSLPHPFL